MRIVWYECTSCGMRRSPWFAQGKTWPVIEGTTHAHTHMHKEKHSCHTFPAITLLLQRTKVPQTISSHYSINRNSNYQEVWYYFLLELLVSSNFDIGYLSIRIFLPLGDNYFLFMLSKTLFSTTPRLRINNGWLKNLLNQVLLCCK